MRRRLVGVALAPFVLSSGTLEPVASGDAPYRPRIAFVTSAAEEHSPDVLPPIGARVRVVAPALGPDWRVGMFNRLRVEPPCYRVILFTPDAPLRVEHRLAVRDLARLQVSTGQDGRAVLWASARTGAPSDGEAWRDVALDRLRAAEGRCGVGRPANAPEGETASPLELESPFDTPLGRKYRTELNALAIAPRHLPPTCRLARDVATGRIFPATTNPFVTDDAHLIEFVSTVGFGTLMEGVRVAFSALFHEAPRHEVGIWGLRFDDAEAASHALGRVRSRDVLVKDSLVLALWRDDDTGKPCQETIERHLIRNGFTSRTPKP